MKIALTGGTGLVGNALGKKLTDLGHSLIVYSRRPESARADLCFPCEIFPWNGEGLPPAESLPGLDAFIHLAGESIADGRWTGARKKALRDSRVRPLENLKKAFKNSPPPKVMISASAVGYYGDRGDEVLRESAAPGQDFLGELCAEWESAAREVPAQRHVQVRIGVVLAPQGGFLKTVVPMFVAFGASRLGSGRQWTSWIHIDDLVQVFVKALEDPKLNGPINAVSPNPVTNSELTQTLKETLHAPWGPPAPALGLRAIYGNMADILLGSQRVQPGVLSKIGFKWRHAQFKSALEEIYPSLRSGEMQLVFEQWLERTPEEIWPFFCDEKNLEILTPKHLSFNVLGKNTDQIGMNTLINYQIKLRGIPMNWTSRIGEWDPPREFSDEQVKGPYKSWHHSHRFKPLAGGTLMTDVIRFRVPGGWPGRLVGLMQVKKEVETIFSFRAKAIKETFCSR